MSGKKVALGCTAMLIVGFLGMCGLGAFLAYSPSMEGWRAEQEAKQQAEAEAKQAEADRLAARPRAEIVEERVRAIAAGHLRGTQELRSVEVNGILDDELRLEVGGDFRVVIRYRAAENFTKGMTVTSIYMDVRDISEEVYEDTSIPDVDNLVFQPHLALVDRFGNESEEPVAIVTVPRDLAERINWENMEAQRFRGLIESENLASIKAVVRD